MSSQEELNIFNKWAFKIEPLGFELQTLDSFDKNGNTSGIIFCKQCEHYFERHIRGFVYQRAICPKCKYGKYI